MSDDDEDIDRVLDDGEAKERLRALMRSAHEAATTALAVVALDADPECAMALDRFALDPETATRGRCAAPSGG